MLRRAGGDLLRLILAQRAAERRALEEHAGTEGAEPDDPRGPAAQPQEEASALAEELESTPLRSLRSGPLELHSFNHTYHTAS